MPRVTCPNCDKSLVVPDSLAGKAGRCPGCLGRVDIPPLRAKAREDEVFDSVEELEEDAPRRLRQDEDDRISARRGPGRTRRDEEDEDRYSTSRSDGRSRRGEDDDDYDRPGRRHSREEDDDYDRPGRRRSREDDDDLDYRRARRDDPPRRRRRRRESSGGGGGGLSSGVITAGIMGAIVLALCMMTVFVPKLAVIPLGLGCIIATCGSLWFLFVAFQDDVMQGILCWFVPFYAIYYLATHFDEEKYPFFTYVGGVLMIFAGMCAGGAGGAHR